jgi:hypothetical protein
MSSNFHTDFSQFDKTFKPQEQALLEAAEVGVGQAMMQLIRDSVMVAPTVPHDEGTLRGSGSAFVGTKLIYTTPSEGGQPTPAAEHDLEIPGNTIFGVAGFNTPYAARLHEHPEYRFQGEGTGGKYMISKMKMFKDQYRQLVVDSINNAEHIQE